jgi:hypothetical protein
MLQTTESIAVLPTKKVVELQLRTFKIGPLLSVIDIFVMFFKKNFFFAGQMIIKQIKKKGTIDNCQYNFCLMLIIKLLFVFPSVCPPIICPSAFLSVCSPICLSVCLSVLLSVCLSAYLSVSPPACLSVRLPD